MPLVAAHKILG